MLISVFFKQRVVKWLNRHFLPNPDPIILAEFLTTPRLFSLHKLEFNRLFCQLILAEFLTMHRLFLSLEYIISNLFVFYNRIVWFDAMFHSPLPILYYANRSVLIDFWLINRCASHISSWKKKPLVCMWKVVIDAVFML